MTGLDDYKLTQARLTADRLRLEAVEKEIQAAALLDSTALLNELRAKAHDLLDAMLDNQAAMAVALQKIIDRH